jgi:hypothetical protein
MGEFLCDGNGRRDGALMMMVVVVVMELSSQK